MIGRLAVSFCERDSEQRCVCLDVWSYPDGTYNLVIQNLGGKNEIVLPCAFYQLEGVLKAKPLVSEGEAGTVTIERCQASVCARFEPFDREASFCHCIAAEQYVAAIEALKLDVVGYLA